MVSVRWYSSRAASVIRAQFERAHPLRPCNPFWVKGFHSLQTRYGDHVWRETWIRNEAVKCSPGAITRRASPEESAFVLAGIGSMAMKSLSFGAKIWAKEKPVSNSMAME